MLKELEMPIGESVQYIRDCIAAKLVCMLHGSPGITKSAVIHEVGAENNLCIIDMRFAGFDPTDLNGFPAIDQVKGIATYYPFDTFPIESTPLPINPKTNEPYAGWLLFADELTNAPMTVQAASYKFFLDRMVGPHKLNSKCHIIAAGNLADDGAAAVDMSSALVNRIIHLRVKEDLQFWLKWAQKGNACSLITSYLEWRPANFYTFNKSEPDQPFASPRSWTFVDDLLKVWNRNPLGKVPVIGGAIGGVAHEFVAFAEMRRNLPKKAEIIANPTTTVVPGLDKPGPLFALSGALGDWFEKDHAKAFMEYINRLAPDFQIVTMRNIVRRQGQSIMGHPDVNAWMRANATEMVS